MKTFIDHDIGELIRETNSDGRRVYKTPSGRAYPSVTSVTGLHGKQSIMEWRKRVGEEEANRISNRAATRGTKVHQLCEDYLRTGNAEPDIFDSTMFTELKPFLSNIDNIHCLETPLYSDHLQVAGTVDCIAEYNGKLKVIDFKTSTKAKDRDHIHNYFMQCAAYAVAFEERTGIPVDKMLIIMATDTDGVVTFEEKRDDWIGGFIKVREDYSKLYNI